MLTCLCASPSARSSTSFSPIAATVGAISSAIPHKQNRLHFNPHPHLPPAPLPAAASVLLCCAINGAGHRPSCAAVRDGAQLRYRRARMDGPQTGRRRRAVPVSRSPVGGRLPAASQHMGLSVAVSSRGPRPLASTPHSSQYSTPCTLQQVLQHRLRRMVLK